MSEHALITKLVQTLSEGYFYFFDTIAISQDIIKHSYKMKHIKSEDMSVVLFLYLLTNSLQNISCE